MWKDFSRNKYRPSVRLLSCPIYPHSLICTTPMTFYQLWFKVQDQRTALPIVLDGHNLIAQAQSGAGKTELLLVLGC
jgi:hypothetical protein